MIVAMMLSIGIYGQHTVTGKVLDSMNEALIGVNISETGTDRGTITDVDGSFTLDVSSDQTTLIVSYIGYTIIKFFNTLNYRLIKVKVLD